MQPPRRQRRRLIVKQLDLAQTRYPSARARREGPTNGSMTLGIRQLGWLPLALVLSSLDERSGSADLLREGLRNGISYESLLGTTTRVDSVVARSMQESRVQIDNAEELQLELAIAFALVGLAASLAVFVLTLRDRHF